jgi:hypothetical protein
LAFTVAEIPMITPMANNVPSVSDRLYDWEYCLLSHLEACLSVDTVLYSPSTVSSQLCRTVKCPTSSTVHRPPRRSISGPPHRHHIKMQYSHRCNAMIYHAITAVVIITSGPVSICVPT